MKRGSSAPVTLRSTRTTTCAIRTSRSRRHQVRGYQELTSGLMAAAAGDLSEARSHNRQAERLLPDNGSLLLLQAQTAQLEGK